MDFQLNPTGSLLGDEPLASWHPQAFPYAIPESGIDLGLLEQITLSSDNTTQQHTLSPCPRELIRMVDFSGFGTSLHSLLHETPALSSFSTIEPGMSLLSAQAAGIEPWSSTAPKLGLFRRRPRSFGSQLSTYYLLQTLRSYPKMLVSGARPPFIHKNCGGGAGTLGGADLVHSSMLESMANLPLPEPLAICASIMSMYFSKTSQSTSFVWRTIDMELDRLDREFGVFDEWTLMAALQAVTIYILVATLEDDNVSPGVDAKILYLMMGLAAKIEEPTYAQGLARHGEWGAWILQESRDRTFTLLFIINKLFEINPTHDPSMCNAILPMPVPAHRSLWEAPGYPEWKKAHSELLLKRGGRPPLVFRDMVELQQKSPEGQNQTLGDLDDWFLNLDAFGTFVLMTATLF